MPKKKTKEVTQEKQTLVYVGQSYPNVVTHGEMFNNGVPERLKQLSTLNPVVAALIIPITDLPMALKAIKNKTGRYYAAYIRTGGKLDV
ncbi:MAG: hypothetical protein ACI4Q8_06380 [Ruminococcus sp.]